jgi:hypothetical protein
MTALVADRNTQMKDTELLAVPVAAGVKLFIGALCCANATGYATPGATSTALAYLGRVEEFVDNTTGADGAKTALIRRNKQFKWANLAADAVTQARVGRRCFIADDQTVAATNGNGTRSPAGIVTAVDADGVWVAEMSGNSLSATAALTFAAIAAAGSNDQTITVPGAAVGDSVELGLPAAPAAGIVFFAFVSAPDTVTVRGMNITAAPVTPPAAATYRATVHKA